MSSETLGGNLIARIKSAHVPSREREPTFFLRVVIERSMVYFSSIVEVARREVIGIILEGGA